jgi:ADP-ribose pyrophosphatase YjhB (NUDIX family)
VKFCPRCATPFGAEVIEGYRRPVCPQCGFIFYLDPKVAVACLIPLDGGILLGRRAITPGLGLWSFPSGYVNKGERLEDAAEREVLEETALCVRMERLVNVYSEPDNPVVLVVYEARVVDGTPQAGAEMTELQVFPPSGLPSMAFSHDQEIVADWQATLRE